MFTPPQISSNNDINSRSFIYFYYNKKRLKFYNGNKLNLPIFPNHAKTIKERNRLLNNLQQEFHKALLENWNPLIEVAEKPTTSIKESFEVILSEKLNSPYSKSYKRDLNSICEQFLNHIPVEFHNKDVSEISLEIVEKFLSRFKTSGRSYMNKRRTLSIFFSELVRKEHLTKNPINRTSKQKVKAKLHEIYTEQQLKSVFDFLKADYYNLYLCALITYGCLLRPHQEVRNLKLKHINNNFTEIHLSGNENKSGRIRTVHIPIYLQNEMQKHLKGIVDLETNIFSLNNMFTYNDDYFKTQWSRAKTQMLSLGLITKNQTLYSFRHTAAVNVYKKTKDLNVLQQLLQHSNMIVTLNYLRGLGVLTNQELKSFMPELANI